MTGPQVEEYWVERIYPTMNSQKQQLGGDSECVGSTKSLSFLIVPNLTALYVKQYVRTFWQIS